MGERRWFGEAEAQISPDISAEAAEELRLFGACGANMKLERSAFGELRLDHRLSLAIIAFLGPGEVGGIGCFDPA
jgi:hypothetical protein